MSTRSTIGYETESGGYVGVYCHYDGYPDNILPALAIGHGPVKVQVERALLEAGLRTVIGWETFRDAKGETSKRDQWLESAWPCTQQEYNYRVRLDGTVECIKYDGSYVTV